MQMYSMYCLYVYESIQPLVAVPGTVLASDIFQFCWRQREKLRVTVAKDALVHPCSFFLSVALRFCLNKAMFIEPQCLLLPRAG